ncbi:glycosyltransferase [Vulcanisaeta thermophila]|uniref:glycosyltransferase n=1 Tax=Vulcanisaeta thermophila TaxID=867917 RepID=UPI001EE26A0B|nr:glycosyltransferase [Vulcanisaeta thermophila]
MSKHRSSEREDALVFFARLSRAKGPEQAIRVTRELVKRGLKVKTYIMGSVSDQVGATYVRGLMKLVSDLGINRNVTFIINSSIREAYTSESGSPLVSSLLRPWQRARSPWSPGQGPHGMT